MVEEMVWSWFLKGGVLLIEDVWSWFSKGGVLPNTLLIWVISFRDILYSLPRV
jgi:hypothetical protein